MDKKQMLDFIKSKVYIQGNQGASDISPLLISMVEKLFADPVTGATPIVVELGSRKEVVGSRTTYDISTPQPYIDTFIDLAFEEQENTRLFVSDHGALLGFSLIEITEDSISGKLAFTDGEFGLHLTKAPGQSYFYHEEEIVAIPHVTQGEVEAYHMLFNTTYDKVNNKYMLLVGATEVQLTPAEMIIVNEEYNKTSTDGNYTALWANSIAKYICCAPWFDGFLEFRMHSAFKNSKNVMAIDLNIPTIAFKDMTSAFEGCSRLEQISGIIKVKQGSLLRDTFKGCTVLHTFKLHGLSNALDLSDCAQLSKETMLELINNADSNYRFTVTLHSSVYANMQQNPDWVDAKNASQVKNNIQFTSK